MWADLMGSFTLHPRRETHPRTDAMRPTPEASNFANTPQNASDVAPGAESASTELQPDTTPTPDPAWSGRHTAILLIAITLSLFIGYALAYIYRRLADGKKARMMDEARMDDEAARPPSSPRMEAAESPPSRA